MSKVKGKKVKKIQRPKQKVLNRKFDWRPAMVLCVLSFLIYANTLNHELAFDDALAISQNKYTAKGIAGFGELLSSDFFEGALDNKGDELAGGRYRPLSLLMFALEAQLFGEKKKDPSGKVIIDAQGDNSYEYPETLGHWTNVLLYAFSIFLLYYLLHLWFAKVPKAGAIPFIAVLLFAVHPVHSEVVANIKSRDEILSLLFLLGTLLFWHKWLHQSSKTQWIVLSGVFFLLSLLAKETPFTYIAIFPLIDWVVYRSKSKELIKRSLPLWVVGIGYLILRTSIVGLPQASVDTTGIMDNPFAGSDMTTKLATISLICLRYLGLLFFPLVLRSDYSFNHTPLVGFNHPEAILGFLVYLVLIGTMFYLIKKRSWYSLLLAMFLLPLSVTTNLLFNIGAPMGERFLYLPSIGFALFAAVFAMRFLKFEELKFSGNTLGLFVLGAFTGFFSYKTIARNPDWKNNQTLFTADVESTPKSAKMQNYQARVLFTQWRESEKGEANAPLLEKAKYHYDQSATIYPQFQLSLYDLGLVNLYRGDGDAAIDALERCLRLNNRHAMTHELMAQVQYRLKKDYQSAANHLRFAVEELDERKASSMQDLGIYYASAGKGDSAIYYLKEAIELDPSNILSLIHI